MLLVDFGPVRTSPTHLRLLNPFIDVLSKRLSIMAVETKEPEIKCPACKTADLLMTGREGIDNAANGRSKSVPAPAGHNRRAS